MQKGKTIYLDTPLMIKGEEMKELFLKTPTVGDEEDAMQQAVRMKRSDNPLAVEMCLFSRLARIPYDVLRSMSPAEYKKIREAYNEMSDFTGEIENPTADLTEFPV